MSSIYNILLLVIIIHISLFLLGAGQNKSDYKIENNQIIKPLIASKPDPEKGKEVVISRVGNCLACHKISAINEPFQGNIGPNLDGVGTKYTQGELRLRLVDPYYLNPESLMPAFFQNENIYRVAKKYSGKTILTAQQIEDVISWLLTLK